MKRKIVKIDEKKCNGCGKCIPNCPEGALQIIDGKARLVSDLFCDGLGACIGHCPEGAMTVEERETEKYDEKKVMQNIVKHGKNTIKAHLKHLRDHGEKEYLREAIEYLEEKGIENPLKESGNVSGQKCPPSGCPGSRIMELGRSKDGKEAGESQLRQWPVQLHLVNPCAPYYQEKDIVLAADCTAFAFAGFHSDFLKGKSVAIGCPKLDSDKETYVEKLRMMIDESKINTLTVITMEVPCCAGLVSIAKNAAESAKRKVPLKSVIISVHGKVLNEEWL